MDATLEALIKLWGPLGVIVFGLGLLIWKKLIPMLEKRDEEYRVVLKATLDDARKERDAARQLLESQANKFLESSARRDDVMEKGFDEILHEIRNQQPRRK